MKRRWIGILVAVAFLVVGSSAFGFNMPKFGGKSGAPAVSTDEIMKRQSQLVKSYMAAAREIVTAQKFMAEAFGFKERVEELDATIKVLGSGNVLTKDAIEKVRALTEKMDAAIDEKMEKNEQLSSEGKNYYFRSMKPYFKGLVITKSQVVPEADRCLRWTKQQIENAPWLEKMKVKKTADVILYLAPKVGPDVLSMVSTGTKYITYAKKNGVKVPKNAADALGEI
jgi:hypothetical protein